jgi:cytochrome bd-type quinol oxidase subunit 1
MKDLLNRLALVVHWTSFLVGFILATVIIYYAFLNLTTVRTLDGGYDTQYLLESALFLIPISILPLLLGWLIRYILSGKAHILPWKKL